MSDLKECVHFYINGYCLNCHKAYSQPIVTWRDVAIEREMISNPSTMDGIAERADDDSKEVD